MLARYVVAISLSSGDTSNGLLQSLLGSLLRNDFSAALEAQASCYDIPLILSLGKLGTGSSMGDFLSGFTQGRLLRSGMRSDGYMSDGGSVI